MRFLKLSLCSLLLLLTIPLSGVGINMNYESFLSLQDLELILLMMKPSVSQFKSLTLVNLRHKKKVQDAQAHKTMKHSHQPFKKLSVN